jgi:hypothetical protein
MFIGPRAPSSLPSSVGAACACGFVILYWQTKPARWRHAAPTELAGTPSLTRYKHGAPTELCSQRRLSAATPETQVFEFHRKQRRTHKGQTGPTT